MRILWLLLLLLPLPCEAQSPRQLYNEACAAALAGQQDQALQHLRAAVNAGFDDFRFAAQDPDLSSLVGTPAFEALATEQDSRLTLLSSEMGQDMRLDQWTGWQELGPETEFRLRWETGDLAYEIRLRGAAARELKDKPQPPWVGGPGLFLTLAVPDGSSAYESANTFHLALGRNKSGGVGALYGGDVLGWQPVQELAPAVERPAGDWDLQLNGKVTWQTILPYHPLADPLLGFNLSLRAVNQGPVISWLADPAAFSTVRAPHRFVPLRFEVATIEHEALVGRPGHSLVEGGILPLDLVVFAREPGPGVLRIDFLDAQQRSVLAKGPVPVKVDLQSGRNVIDREADFSALNRGPYLLKVELDTPAGTTLTWSGLVLNLGAGWRAEFEKRIAGLPELQQTTGTFYLEAVDAAARGLASRRHPGSLTTTLLELETFLGAAEAHGSILPESGVFRVAWPAPAGARLVTLFLPEGYRQAVGLRPVVLSLDTPGIETRMADRMQRFYSFGEVPETRAATERQQFPVYLLCPSTEGRPLTERAMELAALLDWTRRFFAAQGVWVAGMNGGADPLLELLAESDLNAPTAMILAGARLEPWPGQEQAALEQRLRSGAAKAPALHWLEFFQETALGGQAKLLLSVLRDSGYNLAAVEEVKGGLSLTQVADRVVLWAEETP